MKKTFRTEIVLEQSITSKVESLGFANCEMELIIHKTKQSGCIIWNIDYEDNDNDSDEIVIGLWFEGNKVVDYDGVFGLPSQAINLLKSNGFDISEIE